MNTRDEQTILAIETSCDETGIAVLRGTRERSEVLSHTIASQVDVHTLTGGVVPEVAAREHATVIGPLITSTLQKAQVTSDDITGIAVTTGPGLLPALTIGVTAARALAYAWRCPIVPVNHLEGHIYAALMQASAEETAFTMPADAFPALALIVSGGHTLLIRMNDHDTYEVLGTTRDDAAGEAFDKVARLLGLSYPGGPAIAEAALAGDGAALSFPQPMARADTLDMSFSGLKTAVLYKTREYIEAGEEIPVADVAASFQATVVQTLVGKVEQALEDDTYKRVLLTGGVAANTVLRDKMVVMLDQRGVALATSPLPLCGDNGVMIGLAGIAAATAGRTAQPTDVHAEARPLRFRN